MSGFTGLDPLPQTHRGWIALVVTAVLFIVSFFLVVRFYDAEGGGKVTGASLEADGQQALVISVEPVSVDANVNEAPVHLRFQLVGDEFADADGRPVNNVRVTVTDGSGMNEYKFPAGTVLSQRDQVLAMDGDSSLYPFDFHEARMLFAADTYTRNSDGSLDSTGSIPIGLVAEGGVNGWDTTVDLFSNIDESGRVTSEVQPMALLGFGRAFSTQVFALLIVAIAGILAILALITGALVQADRRPAETALLSWTAALLFALPLLRTYLPNGPPFGASIDMYAYLWFILASGAAAVLMVFGWNGQRLAERKRAQGGGHAA